MAKKVTFVEGNNWVVQSRWASGSWWHCSYSAMIQLLCGGGCRWDERSSGSDVVTESTTARLGFLYLLWERVLAGGEHDQQIYREPTNRFAHAFRQLQQKVGTGIRFADALNYRFHFIQQKEYY